MLWSYENTFCVQRKQNEWLFSTIYYLLCQSSLHIQESTTVWCCWCRSRCSDIEPECAAACLQAEECMCMRFGTLTEEKKLMIKVFFSLRTKYFHCFIKLCLLIVIWTILTVSLLPFVALNVSIALRSIEQGSESKFGIGPNKTFCH